jgi:hypothetical protein
MRNLLPQREKYLINFADSVYDQYLKQKYGIQSCRKSGKLWIDELRKDIANYQYVDDGGALCQVSIQQMGWLPVYYPSYDDSCDYRPPWCDVSKYQIQRCSAPSSSSVGMSYAGNGGSANLIEVNSGGCITRININPSITINNNTGTAFTYAQNCADPQAVWYINHNLGYTPNAWTEDCDGNDISGTLAVVNSNTITITFSTAQAGTAHLS